MFTMDSLVFLAIAVAILFAAVQREALAHPEISFRFLKDARSAGRRLPPVCSFGWRG